MSGKRLDTKPALEPAYTVRDLMVLTHLGREKVKRLMREGTLPGIVDGRSYTCPRSLWDAYCRGEWRPRPQQTAPSQSVPMIRRRSASDKETSP